MTPPNEPDTPLILAYHSVSDTRVDNLAVRTVDFERQIAWLSRRGYRSMTLAQYLEDRPSTGDRVVVITFDDGYADNYHQAFPVLHRYGFTATVFLVSDYVDTAHIYWWDRWKIREDDTPYRILSWNQVHEMQEYGIEFGSHTRTHARLTQLPVSRCDEEVNLSRTALKIRLRREIQSFSYPAGNLNPRVINAVQKAGYRCGVVTPTSSNLPKNEFTLRRVGVYYPNNWPVFRLKISRLFRQHYERLRGLRNR